MARLKSWFGAAGAALLLTPAAQAQPQEEPAAPEAAAEAAAPAATGPDPDEMADLLNSRQQIKQTFTVTRTIDGEVTETEQRTVVYSRGGPARPTEAGESAIDSVEAAFDREVLTRTEAFEEAKLDFALADKNRDGRMDEDEFVALALSWRDNAAREAEPADEETARQRQYQAFVEELDPEAAKGEHEEEARRRFAFMAGAAGSISLEDYIREYLLDFDSMDENRDMLLRGGELSMFRALNRGERTNTE